MTTHKKGQPKAARTTKSEEFESRLDVDLSPLLPSISRRTGVGEQDLAQSLADSLQRTAKPLQRNVSKHWLDVFAFAVVATAIFLVARPWWFPPKPETVVRAAEDIPAFTVIAENQLKVDDGIAPSQQTKLKQPFVGKYSPELISKNSIIPSKIGSYQKASFSGRMILRLETKTSPPLDGRPYPQNVELVFAARNPGPSGVIVPALLLASDATSHSVTVALLPHDAQLATAWLGSSEVSLVWRSP